VVTGFAKQKHATVKIKFGHYGLKQASTLLCTLHKAYGTAWGTETIFATAGTPAVLSTKSI